MRQSIVLGWLKDAWEIATSELKRIFSDGGVVLMDNLLMIFRYRNILCPARQQAQGCQQEESEFFHAVLYLRLTSI